MPFINEIVTIINDELKGGSLNKEKLQPAKFYGLSTPILRKKGSDNEQLPAIVTADGKIEVIAPDGKIFRGNQPANVSGHYGTPAGATIGAGWGGAAAARGASMVQRQLQVLLQIRFSLTWHHSHLQLLGLSFLFTACKNYCGAGD
jgi:hypothetical protein